MKEGRIEIQDTPGRESVEEILERAMEAFWAEVADSSLAEYGDVPPDAARAFEHACRRAVCRWLYDNDPRYRDLFPE